MDDAVSYQSEGIGGALVGLVIILLIIFGIGSCISTYNDCDRDNGRVMKNQWGVYECVEKGEHP